MFKTYSYKVLGLILVFIIIPFLVVKIALLGERLDIMTVLWMLITSIAMVISGLFLVKRHIELETVNLNELRIVAGMDVELMSKIDALVNESRKLQSIICDLSERSEAYHRTLVANDALILEEKNRLSILEHELTSAKKISDNLMDLTSQYLLKIDREGNIIKMNKAFIHRLGYQVSDIEGKNIRGYIDVNQNEINACDGDVMAYLKFGKKQPILLAFKLKTLSSTAIEHIGMTTYESNDGTLLCIGKAVNDEIALQSNILRKNRELEYINQINASLVSNWDIDTLLDNIIKRIDYLFNIKFGCIHMLDDSGQWVLKSFTSKRYKYDDLENLNLESYFYEIDSQIKSYQVDQTVMNYLNVSPLVVDDKTIAIISIGLDQEMNNNDINILKMFKNQTAMVIQRALIYDQLRGLYLGTIEALVNVIEAKDKYTEGHSRRVSRFSVEIAKEMGYSNEEVENIEIAGLLHDIGKIGIDYGILTKRGRLTPEEYEIIQSHPTKGAQILEAISLDQKIKDGILYHHLRYDLTGYPYASLEELPTYACIIGIADAFDAITSARSYNKARSMQEAIEELKKHEGSQFDPMMVSIFQKMLKEKPDVLKHIIDDINY